MDYNLFGSLEQSMMALWVDVVRFMPQLVMAALVLILGWIVGGIVGRLVVRVFKTLRLNELLDKAGVDNLSKRAGYAFKPGLFVGKLVKWFVFLIFLVVAFDIMNLQEITVFMRDVVLGYIPQVFAAVLILFAAMIIAGLARKSIEAVLRTGGSENPEFFGSIAYYLVIAFAVMAALNQLKIAEELVQTLFMGMVFALALGLGLAFGLGGKESASRYIEKMSKNKPKKHHEEHHHE